MSSVGQALGGLVGGVIGFIVGGPTGAYYGAQIGIMAGGLLDPPKTVGPRLTDLSAQTSTYGAFIPRIYGTVSLTGNVFWLQGDKLTETKETQSGKGGPEVTTFKYSATFAVGLCEGPIAGVRRIWVGSDLWYDATGGTSTTTVAAIMASNSAASNFTLYLGTEDQEADPLIQADRGIANVPAHRGLAYIVFHNLPLEKYGNSLMAAQIKVEVVRDTITPVAWARTVTNTATGVQFAANDGRTGVGIPWISSVSDGVVRISIRGTETQYLFSYEGQYLGRGTQYRIDCLNPTAGTGGETWRPLGRLNGTHLWGRSNTAYLIGTRSVLHYQDDFTPGSIPGQGPRICHNLPQDRSLLWCSVANDEQSVIVVLGDIGQTSGNYYNAVWYILDPSGNILDSGTAGQVENSGGFGRSVISFDSVAFDQDGYQVANAYGAGTGAITIWTIGEDKVLRSLRIGGGATGAGLSYWTFTYPSVYIQDGVVFAVSYDDFNGFHAAAIYTPSTTLSSIVQSECLKSGLLTAADIDVTQLTDSVRGYRVSQRGPIRGGIDPLRRAWPFDVRQHGYKIQFVRRGAASVATVAAEDLDARSAGEPPGVKVTNEREMAAMLPRQVIVKYLDAAREYDINKQEQSRT